MGLPHTFADDMIFSKVKGRRKMPDEYDPSKAHAVFDENGEFVRIDDANLTALFEKLPEDQGHARMVDIAQTDADMADAYRTMGAYSSDEKAFIVEGLDDHEERIRVVNSRSGFRIHALAYYQHLSIHRASDAAEKMIRDGNIDDGDNTFLADNAAADIYMAEWLQNIYDNMPPPALPFDPHVDDRLQLLRIIAHGKSPEEIAEDVSAYIGARRDGVEEEQEELHPLAVYDALMFAIYRRDLISVIVQLLPLSQGPDYHGALIGAIGGAVGVAMATAVESFMAERADGYAAITKFRNQMRQGVKGVQ